MCSTSHDDYHIALQYTDTIQDDLERCRAIKQLEEMEKELDDLLLEQTQVDELQFVLQEETQKFETLQRVVKKKEEEVKKCYDNLATLAVDFQLLKVAPSEVASTAGHQSSDSHSSGRSGVSLPL